MNHPTTRKIAQFLRQNTRKLLLLALCVAAACVLTLYLGKPLVAFVRDTARLQALLQAHPVWTRLCFVGMVFVQTVLAVIPGEPFELAAGYAFGAWEGAALCLLGNTLGGMLIFLLVRRFGVALVARFFSHEQIHGAGFLRTSPARKLLYLLIYTIPGTPKDFLCYFAGLTDLRPVTWLLICSLGRLPSILTSTLGGDALGARRYVTALWVLGITLGISALGLLLYRRLTRRHAQAAHKDTPVPKQGCTQHKSDL